MRDDRLNQIQSEMNHLTNLRRNLRQQEKSLRAREEYLAQPQQFTYGGAKQIKSNLQGALAPQMMPCNVGALNEVAWPFFFQVPIDFGADPSISQTTLKKGFFQVDQEASFLLMSRGINYGDIGAGSALQFAPMKVDFIDRQSSRRFNTNPVPIQNFGDNSNPTILPTSMLIMPNAFLDVEVTGIPEVAQAFTGSGVIQFSFFGYRTRVENAGKVLSTIFGV